MLLWLKIKGSSIFCRVLDLNNNVKKEHFLPEYYKFQCNDTRNDLYYDYEMFCRELPIITRKIDRASIT